MPEGAGCRGADGSLFSLAQSFVHPRAEELLALDFERIGRLQYKGGLNLERAKEGWFALAGSALHVCFEDGERQEPLQLRKLQELCACPCPAAGPPPSWEGPLGGGVSPKSHSKQLGCTLLLVGGWWVLLRCSSGSLPPSGMQPLFLLSILFPIPGKSLLVPFGLELDPLAQPPHGARGWGGPGDPVFLQVTGSLPSLPAIQGDNEVLVLVERRR